MKKKMLFIGMIAASLAAGPSPELFAQVTVPAHLAQALLAQVTVPGRSSPAPGVASGDGNAIVAEMDRRMNFDQCRMLIRIEDAKADGKTRVLEARVEYLRGVGTRLDFAAPARDRGKSVLMADGSMWMSAPTVSKPVRLSGKDSFMGTSFTNDDAMNLEKSDDYEAKIVSSDAEAWDLVLTARSPELPYPRIEARVGRDYLPLRMAYFTRSGRESKRVEFSAPKAFGGKLRPSAMSIVDLMKPGDRSRLLFLDIREEAVSRSRLLPSSLGK